MLLSATLSYYIYATQATLATPHSLATLLSSTLSNFSYSTLLLVISDDKSNMWCCWDVKCTLINCCEEVPS